MALEIDDRRITASVNSRTESASVKAQNTSDNRTFSAIFSSVTQSIAAPVNTATRQDTSAVLSRDDYRSHLIEKAKADPDEAERLLSLNASSQSGDNALIDISHWPVVRYSVSGELQTTESEHYFNTVSLSASNARSELVQSERAKGTPTAAILEKVLALNSALPERYKAMANISY